MSESSQHGAPHLEADEQQGHTARIHAIAFHSESKLIASCSRDGFILLWDTEHGKK